MQMTNTQLEKTGNLLLLISHQIPHLYLTKLLKLVYLVDEKAVKTLGFPITWLTYKAWQYGPVATAIYDDLSFNSGTLFGQYIQGIEERLELPDYKGKGIKIVPNAPLNKDVFSRKELDIIDEVLTKYGDLDGKKLVHLLHAEHTLWDKIYKEKNLKERFEYTEYNTSPFEIDFTQLIEGDEEKLSIYRSMEEFMDFSAAFSE